MVRNTKAGLFMLCLLGSHANAGLQELWLSTSIEDAPAQLSTAIDSGVLAGLFKTIQNVGHTTAHATSKIVDFANKNTGAFFVGSVVALTGLACYQSYKNYRRNKQYRFEEAERKELAKLVECKKWAETNFLAAYDQLNIEQEVLDNSQAWEGRCQYITAEQLALFKRPCDVTCTAPSLLRELRAGQLYTQQLFESYKTAYNKLGTCDRTYDAPNHAYYTTMIPVYLKKLAFIEKLLTLRCNDFDQLSTNAHTNNYRTQPCHSTYCTGCCSPCRSN